MRRFQPFPKHIRLMAMRITAAILFAAISVVVSAQAPAPSSQPRPFTVSVDVVQTDAIVRDARGQFIADLKAGEFEVYEDGVKQELVALTMIHGGRDYNVLSAPAPPRDGLILPPNRPRSEVASRLISARSRCRPGHRRRHPGAGVECVRSHSQDSLRVIAEETG